VLALQNAASIAICGRRYDAAVSYATRAGSIAADGPSRDLSETYIDLMGASGTLSLPALAVRLEHLLGSQLRQAQWHYAAITSLNLAQVLVWLDRPDDAAKFAGEPSGCSRGLRRAMRQSPFVSCKPMPSP